MASEEKDLIINYVAENLEEYDEIMGLIKEYEDSKKYEKLKDEIRNIAYIIRSKYGSAELENILQDIVYEYDLKLYS